MGVGTAITARRSACASGIALALLAPAHGFGPQGHRIAGLVAERHLCRAARLEIERLGGGLGLERLGLWADGIRGEARWAHTAPWHYMNIADRASLDAHGSPAEGDILWAIEHFWDRLADQSLATGERSEALRFLVHFIVDLHQPLHVGRAADRGGNTIELRLGEQLTNLHRFWDTDVIRLEKLDAARYARALAPLARDNWTAWAGEPALEWARESRALRASVYELRGERVSEAYTAMARSVVKTRLAQAGVRLAGRLNQLWCAQP